MRKIACVIKVEKLKIGENADPAFKESHGAWERALFMMVNSVHGRDGLDRRQQKIFKRINDAFDTSPNPDSFLIEEGDYEFLAKIVGKCKTSANNVELIDQFCVSIEEAENLPPAVETKPTEKPEPKETKS